MIATFVVMAVLILLIVKYNRQREGVQKNAIHKPGTMLNSEAVAGNACCSARRLCEVLFAVVGRLTNNIAKVCARS